MHKSAQMTVFFSTPLLRKGIIFVFPCSLARTTDEVEHPWFISSRGYFFVVLSSNFVIFQSTRLSPTPEQRGQIILLYLVTLDIDIFGVVDKSVCLLLFQKPIQVLSRFMRSCMFPSTVDVSLVRYAFIVIRLSARPFSGSVCEADGTPIYFNPSLWHGCHLPIGFVLFYKVYSKHLGLLEKT